jgi:hypothetical protein
MYSHKVFILIVFSAIMAICFCDEDETTPNPADLGFTFDRSDCKDQNLFRGDEPSTTDTVHLTTDYLNNVLTVTMVNLYWNCCPEFRYEKEAKRNVITIYTKDYAIDHCHCMCHFDLMTEITGLTKGDYTIKYIIDHEWKDQNVGQFDTLTTTCSIP